MGALVDCSSWKLHLWILQAAAGVPYSHWSHHAACELPIMSQQKQPHRCEILPHPDHRQLNSQPLVSVWLLAASRLHVTKSPALKAMCNGHGGHQQANHQVLPCEAIFLMLPFNSFWSRAPYCSCRPHCAQTPQRCSYAVSQCCQFFKGCEPLLIQQRKSCRHYNVTAASI